MEIVMADSTPGTIFTDILSNKKPTAIAWVGGNMQNPQLSGLVQFYETPYAGRFQNAAGGGFGNEDRLRCDPQKLRNTFPKNFTKVSRKY